MGADFSFACITDGAKLGKMSLVDCRKSVDGKKHKKIKRRVLVTEFTLINAN